MIAKMTVHIFEFKHKLTSILYVAIPNSYTQALR